MAESPSDPDFRATRWSLVERARGADPVLRREALGSLIALYWPALRAHLVVKRRLSPEAADDLLQGFAADRVLKQRFLGHVDRAKGRFRSFLLRCLENYRIDNWRERPQASNLKEGQEEEIPAGPVHSPDVFDVAWARQVLNEALRRTRENCRRQRQSAIWAIFERRVLQPALFDATAPSYDQLVAELGFATEQQAANALVTAKRQFRHALEDVVSEYVKNKADVQAEIIELRVILSIAEHDEAALDSLSAMKDDSAAIDSSLRSAGFDAPNLSAFLDESNPSLLARLFGVDDGREAIWESFDLKNLLARLLATPLAEALPGIDRRAIAAAARSVPGATPGSLTLSEVFADPMPSVELLREIKEWARRSTRAQDSPLPADLASLLYFASIAAARLRRGQWISKLDPSLVHKGLEMLLARDWVGEPFRTLFRQTAPICESNAAEISTSSL
jgi:DNA-directed RNA polymerase specialized sigma24 family protein